MTATYDSHDPENDLDTGIGVAIAYNHPQITHARATSWGRSTGQPERMRADGA